MDIYINPIYLWYRKQSHKEKILVKQARSKDYHDGNAKKLRPLSKGQDILFECKADDSKAHWNKGVILNRNDRSYTVKSQTGCKLVRNRVNLIQYKNQTDKHTCVEVRQPVLVTNLTRLILFKVSIRKDNSVPRVMTRSG